MRISKTPSTRGSYTKTSSRCEARRRGRVSGGARRLRKTKKLEIFRKSRSFRYFCFSRMKRGSASEKRGEKTYVPWGRSAVVVMFRLKCASAVPMLLAPAPRVCGVLVSAAPPAHKARATTAKSAAE
jgi:hypothetical protein